MKRLSLSCAVVCVALAAVLGASAGATPPVGPPGHDQIRYHSHVDTVESINSYDNSRASFPAYDASQWDGRSFTTDQPDLVPAASLPNVHFIYYYPSDAPNRFLEFAPRLQRDARYASDILNQLFGRAFRTDERLGADGTTRYVDITTFRSPKNSIRTLSKGSPFSTVVGEVSRTFKDPNKKYVIWLDGLYPSISACGQAQLAADAQRTRANKNEARSYAVIYRHRTAGEGGEFCSGNTIMHELAHAMGALQQQAPHYNAGHCNDTGQDLMCSGAAVPFDPTQRVFFDFNNDDYWDPAADPASGSSAKLGWWTVNLSRFLCPSTGCAQPNNPSF